MVANEKAAGGPPDQILLLNQQLFMRLQGVLSDGEPVDWAFQPDGSARVYGLQVGVDSVGAEHTFRAETSGEQDIVQEGKDTAGTIRAFETESTAAGVGRLKMLAQLAGLDPASVEVRLRTDDLRILRTHEYEPYRHRDPVGLTAANATLYTVPAGRKWEFELEVHNTDIQGVVATIFRVPSGGAAAFPNQIFSNTVLGSGATIRRGPYILHAGGTIQGSAATANVVTTHIWIREFDNDDEVPNV